MDIHSKLTWAMACRDHNKKDKEAEVILDCYNFVSDNIKSVVSDDYSTEILYDIIEDVIDNVKETSAYEDEGTWNNDDIKLAVGRVLMGRLGLEC